MVAEILAAFHGSICYTLWGQKQFNNGFYVNLSIYKSVYLPHLLPVRTGQDAWNVRSSPVPLGSKLYQRAADPLRGHSATFSRGKTVAPPASTSVICHHVKSNYHQVQTNYLRHLHSTAKLRCGYPNLNHQVNKRSVHHPVICELKLKLIVLFEEK